MISAEEIKNKHFSKAGMSGYKKIEVDVFLDEIVNTINYLTATHAANEKKIADYELKLNEYKNDEQAIQSALVNAQRVSEQLRTEAQQTADDIVFKANGQAQEILSDAKEKSESMLNEAKEKADLILTEAQTLSKELSETTEKMTKESIETATRKAEAITAAAENAVLEQQSLFDALRIQVTMFKRDIDERLNEQLKLVAAFPDEVKRDPSLAAKLAGEAVEEEIPETVEEEAQNDIERIISEMKSNEEKTADFIIETADDGLSEEQVQEAGEDIAEETEPAAPLASSANFTVCLDFDDEDENSDEVETESEAELDDNNSATEKTSFVFSGDISDAEE